MNKTVLVIIILILAVVGAVVINQQNQKSAQIEQEQLMKADMAQKAAQAAAEKAKLLAAEQARKAEEAAKKAEQLAMEKARQAEEATQQKAAELQAQINSMIAQAQTLLNNSQFQQAIDLAKGVLSQDPENTQAKSIIEMATAKLKEVAQEKATALIGQDPVKAAESLPTTVTQP